MSFFLHSYGVDLAKLTVQKRMESLLLTQDARSDRIQVEVFNGGAVYDLSGGTGTAYIMRGDGNTVVVEDLPISGNVMYCDLPAEAYNVPGVVTITLKHTEDGEINSLIQVTATVRKSSSGNAIDPGGEVVLRFEEAIAELEAVEASIPPDYSTLAAGVVRHDTAQTLTDAQKTTARGNIAAASEDAIAPSDATTATSTHNPGDLLTMGGTLYKATQAIAPGTVITPGTNVSPTTVAAQLAERDTAIAAVSSAASAGVLAALDAQAAIDFGWVAGDQTATGAGITAVRNGNRITLNGTVTSGLSSAQRFRMMGNLVTVNGSPTAAQNVSGAVLTNGHRYMTVMRLVSGTAVYSGDGTGFLTLAPYKSGSTSVYFNEVITSDDYTYYMRGGYADGSPLTLWVSFRSGWTFTNATYEVSVYDMTAKAWQSLPTTPTTDGTYTLKVTVTNGVPAYSWAAN